MAVRPGKGLSGNALKGIACLFMLIDHIGAGLYLHLFPAVTYPVYCGYLALRLIGRMAFPIFCFFVVEGFLHTRSVSRYLRRLLLFAFISEIPFDLLNGLFWETGSQNVYFTLFLGLAAIAAHRRWAAEKPWAAALVLMGCIGAAIVLRTDYSFCGVLVIFLLYLARSSELLRALAGGGFLILCYGPIEAACLPAFLLLHFYDGRRGRGNSWLFYGFYPLHLLAISALRIVLTGL